MIRSLIDSLEPRRLLAASFNSVITFGADDEYETANDVAVDASGFVYVVGDFEGAVDFDPSPSGKSILDAEGKDKEIFLAKYRPSGQLVWVRSMGSPDDDSGTEIALGADGAVYIAGVFRNSMPITTGDKTIRLTSAGGEDGFVARFSPSGRIEWAGSFGGTNDEKATALATGTDGDVYLAGYVRLRGDIDPSAGRRFVTARGVDDTFVTRLSGSTGSMVWARVFGELNTREEVLAMGLDNSGHLFITGRFNLTVNINRAGMTVVGSRVDFDVYMARMQTSNGRFEWARSAASGGDDQNVADLAVDGSGRVLLIGTFVDETDFDPGPGETVLQETGTLDGYVAKYTPGGSLLWAGRIGGDNASIRARSLATDAGGRVYASFTNDLDDEEIDMDPGPGVFLLNSDKGGAERLPGEARSTDALLLKLSPGGSFLDASLIGGEDGSARITGLALDNARGRLIGVGAFAEEVDFDPGPGIVLRETQSDNDDSDAFILVLGS